MQHALSLGAVIFQVQLFPLGAVEDDVPHLLAQLLPGGAQFEAVFFRQGVEVHPADAVAADVVPAAGLDGAVQDGFRLVRYHQIGVDLQLAAQTRTGGARAVGVVEGEHAGGQLLDAHAAVLAGIILGEQDVPLLPQEIDNDQTAGQAGGGLHAVRQPLADVRADDQAVHHHLDIVLFVFLQLDLLGQLVERAVHPHPDVPGPPGVLEDLGVLALSGPDHRR